MKYRVAWIKQQEAQKRREEEEAERERVSYAQVKLDCHWLREMELKLSLIWRPTVFPLIENTNSRTFRMLLRSSTDVSAVSDLLIIPDRLAKNDCQKTFTCLLIGKPLHQDVLIEVVMICWSEIRFSSKVVVITKQGYLYTPTCPARL